ncbi:MAG: hypothetical protein QF464_16215, partial [Myxococcota bacterium]|nr:hypothetical protein [Myxococcota bacterium]
MDEDGGFIAETNANPNAETSLWGRVTDDAGNLSPCTDEPMVYTHDDVPPPAPTLEATNPPSPAPTTEPYVLGQAAPGVTIEIFANPNCQGASPLGSGPSDEEGAFEVVVQVSDEGETHLFGHAVDAAGNVSECSNGLVYEYDDSQPEIPQILTSHPASPANENEPALLGIAQAQTTVMIYRNADCEGDPDATAQTNNLGDFEATVLVSDDTTTEFYANALNDLGVFSPCSLVAFVYIEDSQEPLAPMLTHTAPVSPSYAISPEVHGISEGGTLLTFYADPECAGEPTGLGVAPDDGAFAIPAEVSANGPSLIYATAGDAVGNTSACSSPGLPYLHDDIPPPAPLLDATTPPSPSDEVTDPVVLGTADPNTTVTLYATPTCDGLTMGQAQSNALGLVSILVSVDENSATTFFATATDEAGNTSLCSQNGLTFVHDNAVPDPPVLLGTTPESPGTEPLPTLHAQSEPGSTIQTFMQPGCTGFMSGSGVAGPTGLANFQVLVPENALTALYANAVDIGGQISDC